METPKHKLSMHYYTKVLEKKIYLVDERDESKLLDPDDINTKISLYQDLVKYWFLDVAERLKSDNESGFVIVQIVLSYIEGNQQYREGEPSIGGSMACFKRGFKRILFDTIDIPEEILESFYNQVRCGLFMME